MTAPATILFAHAGQDWIRGSEQCLLDLVERLDPARYRSVVACDTPTLAREAERRGARAVRVRDWGGGPFAPSAVRREVRGVLADAGAALVHANAVAALPAVLPNARSLRLPVVAHLHLPMPDAADRLHGLVHQATVAVGVAAHIVAGLVADGSAPERVLVIPNAVNADRLAGGDATGLRAALGIPAGALTVASVGSLIRRKGHDVAVRAVAAARARGLDVHLLVCGDGEEEHALAALAASLAASGRVHLLGRRADVGAILRDAADVYASCARAEALPLNVLEALWFGLPVVASDIAAHREAFVAGESGELVAAEDPEALAGVLTSLAASPERRAALGAAGRALARERYAMARYVGAFDALYAGLLARPRRDYGWVAGSAWPRAYNRWLYAALAKRVRGGR